MPWIRYLGQRMLKYNPHSSSEILFGIVKEGTYSSRGTTAV